VQFISISASSRRVVGGVPELGLPGFAVALASGGGFLVSRRVGAIGRSHAKRVAAATTPAAHAFDAAYDVGAGGCVARCYDGYQKVHEATSLRPAACEAIDGEIECACAKTRMRELGFHVS
jgi:hypothetical protein